MSARHRFRREPSRSRRPESERPETSTTLRIESIAAGGSGVGRSEGVACFVPRTAPNDVAQVALRMRSRFATGRLLQVLEPSPDRVEPRCSHYIADRCGGCQLQHMHGDAQRDARASIVRDAIQRIARRDVVLPRVVAGPSDWEYRRRLTLSLQRRGARWIGGLHPYDDATKVFDLRECPITRPELVRVWNTVREHFHLLPETDSLRIALRLLDDGQVAVVVIGGSNWQNLGDFSAAVADANVGVRDVWWENTSGHSEQVGAPDDWRPVDDALAFVQVNTAVATMLRQHVVERVLAFKPVHVLDAYAGSGLLTEQLAHAGVAVTSIELDERAVVRADQRTRGLSNVTIHAGSVETLVPTALASRPDVIVVNPPRRGLEPELPQLLNDSSTSATRAIVYISCDPATLARDLSGMPDWRISSLQCFDMFPQTAHVETVCLLEPESAS